MSIYQLEKGTAEFKSKFVNGDFSNFNSVQNAMQSLLSESISEYFKLSIEKLDCSLNDSMPQYANHSKPNLLQCI